MENRDLKLTRTLREMIEDSIREIHTTDRSKLCQIIAFKAEEKYSKYNLDFQLAKMHMCTTNKIFEAIDIYFHKHFKEKKFPFLKNDRLDIQL